MRIGFGYDAHRFAEGRPLRLGGVTIPYERGLLSHSDGDAALHALCDALLGAAALGDIGRHFPDSDKAFRNIDSRELLRRVVALVIEKGHRVGNVDVTILAQAPKLAPYIGTMRETIAADLQVPMESVSVKATTTDHMGFVGRTEGIAAQVVVLLE
jgi:2-C-methyl-D-erythritol 2,4-cyclodiphosphate synthase